VLILNIFEISKKIFLLKNEKLKEKKIIPFLRSLLLIKLLILTN
jgi:hypothetical protein